MKKYLLLAIVAVAALSFSSCEKKGDDPTPQEGIVLNVTPKTLELAIGDEEKIRTVVTPAGTEVTVTYTSDNPEVATVSQAGLVSGVAAGTANIIVSAEGAKSDTCVVTVSSAEDMFAWAGWTIWNLDRNTILSNDTALVTLASGQEVHCILVPATARVWGEGISLNMTTGANEGVGYICFVDTVPVYLITEDLGKGENYYYLSASSLQFVDADKFNPNDTAYAYCAKAGKTGDAATQLAFMNNDSETGGIIGAEIWYLDCATYQGYPTVGMIKNSIFVGDENQAYYKSNISWFDNAGGLMVDEAGKEFVEPAAWCGTTDKYYELLPSESAKKYTVADPAILKMHKAEMPRSIKNTEKFHMAK